MRGLPDRGEGGSTEVLSELCCMHGQAVLGLLGAWVGWVEWRNERTSVLPFGTLKSDRIDWHEGWGLSMYLLLKKWW
jgi:hypothetical protein